MPKCPSCHKKIDFLDNFQSGVKVWRFDGDNYSSTHDDFIPDDERNDYECPECFEVLFTDEEDARKFLAKKEKKPKCPHCKRVIE